MVVLSLAALAVAWSLSDSRAQASENRRRIGLLGQLAPPPPKRVHDLRDSLAPVSRRRLRGAIISAAAWLTVVVAAMALWGGAPGTIFLSIVALFYVGDLVVLLRRRRFIARYEAESPER